MNVKFFSSLLGVTGITILAISCTEKDPAGPDAAKGSGRLFLPDGKPAANATVRLYKVSEIPQTAGAPKSTTQYHSAKSSDAALITKTDAQGRYAVGDLSEGEYNILGESEAGVSYQDSVAWSGQSQSLPPDTLESPGTLRGHLEAQPNHDPRTFVVQLLGTNRYANVGLDGHFEFKDLAAGIYSVRLSTSNTEYAPTFTSFRSHVGRETILGDTLVPIFTGIPVVPGLRVTYDTLAGAARISWSRADYRLLESYELYREGPIQREPLATPTDTTFLDPLFHSNPDHPSLPGDTRFRYQDSGRYEFKYRVRIKSKTQDRGPFFDAGVVGAVSPQWVATAFSFSRRRAISTPGITIDDSLAVIVNFKNRTRTIRRLSWHSDADAPPFRVVDVNAREGDDSLRYVTGPVPGISSFVVKAVDDAGTSWSSTHAIPYGDDTPSVTINPVPGFARVGDSLSLGGMAVDQGRIVKWEWAIGPGAPFMRTSTADTIVTIPRVKDYMQDYPCILRATDEDGRSDTSSINLKLLPWKILKPMPLSRHQFATAVLNGKLYAVGGAVHSNIDEYDPATGEWSSKAPMVAKIAPRFNLEAVVMGGRIYAFGGGDSLVEIYDPVSNSWNRTTDGKNKGYPRSGSHGSVIYAFEGFRRTGIFEPLIDDGKPVLVDGKPVLESTDLPVSAYDTLTRKWVRMEFSQQGFGGSLLRHPVMTAVPLEGYTFTTDMGKETYLYDFAARSIRRGPTLKTLLSAHASVGFRGKVLIAGGRNGEYTRPEDRRFFGLEVLDPSDGTLRSVAPIHPNRTHASLVHMEGRIYLMGGIDPGSGSTLNLFEEFIPPLDSAWVNP